ncbi:MAG: hypothetical protein ACM3PR_13840 [Bacteroidales bacterium]
MLEKGFLKNQINHNRRHNHLASILSKILLFLGVLILILSFVFLLSNLGKADRLASVTMPFLVASLGLIVVSQFVKYSFNKLRK